MLLISGKGSSLASENQLVKTFESFNHPVLSLYVYDIELQLNCGCVRAWSTQLQAAVGHTCRNVWYFRPKQWNIKQVEMTVGVCG